MLNGDSIDAETALAWGLVDRISEPDKVLEAAITFARKRGGGKPFAERAIREAVRAAAMLPLELGLGEELRISLTVADSDDAKAGLATFRPR